MIEPVELVGVEHRIAAGNALEREPLDELVTAEQLVVCTRAPAEQGEKVEQRVRQVPLSLVLEDRGRTVPLTEALLVGPHDEGHVREPGRRDTEGLEEQHVLRCVRDVIIPANHMRDLHVDVVDDHREMVGGVPIRAQNHERLEVCIVEADGAVHLIVKRGGAFRDTESDGAFVLVRKSAVDQITNRRAVALEPLRLEVRGVWPSHFRTLVPVDTEPAQSVENAAHHVIR